MLESMSAYYPYDESSTEDPDELIWGRYTEEQWQEMSCEERVIAIQEHELEKLGKQ